MAVVTAISTEAVVLLGLQLPNISPFSSIVCPAISPSRYTKLSSPGATFFIGVSCVVVGGALRLWCYHALKGFFTYEITLAKNHKLVTRGPYSYVRHPSYTGVLLLIVGAHLICLAQGGFIAECGIMHTYMCILVYVWCILSPYTLLGLYKRGFVEDQQLLERFGQVWMNYRETVPYMYVPLVL